MLLVKICLKIVPSTVVSSDCKVHKSLVVKVHTGHKYHLWLHNVRFLLNVVSHQSSIVVAMYDQSQISLRDWIKVRLRVWDISEHDRHIVVSQPLHSP